MCSALSDVRFVPIADIAVFIQSVGAEYSNARDITAGSVEGMRAYSKMAHKRRNLAA